VMGGPRRVIRRRSSSRRGIGRGLPSKRPREVVSLWKYPDKVEALAIVRRGRRYRPLMGFTYRKDAESYLKHHRQKGMRGFIKKAPWDIQKEFGVYYLVYETWED